MDMQLFQRKLEELVRECGGRLLTSPVMMLRPPREESYFPQTQDCCMARREVQPFKIDIVIEAEAVGPWHHVSGDDRRLHPDLKELV